MTIRGQAPALDVREAIEGHVHKPYRPPAPQWAVGNSPTTSFAVRVGYKPVLVFEDDSLRKEGLADYYTVTYDGYVYRVVFASPPNSGSAICFTLEAI